MMKNVILICGLLLTLVLPLQAASGETFLLDGTITWGSTPEEVMAWLGEDATYRSLDETLSIVADEHSTLLGQRASMLAGFEHGSLIYMIFGVDLTDPECTLAQFLSSLCEAFGDMNDDQNLFSAADAIAILGGSSPDDRLANWSEEDGTVIALYDTGTDGSESGGFYMVLIVSPEHSDLVSEYATVP